MQAADSIVSRVVRWWNERHGNARRLLLPAVLLLLAAAALLPIWRVRFLPLLDEPNHLSSVYILHHCHDAWAHLEEFYKVNLTAVPYIVYHLLIHFVAYVTGIEVANKLVLSAYVLSIPLAAVLWARRTDRSPWLAVLTFPLAYSTSWAFGFHQSNFGFVLFLFAACALDAFLEHGRLRSGAVLVGLSLVCDFAHPLGVMALYAGFAVLVLAHRPAPRRLVTAMLLLVPSAMLLGWMVLRRRTDFVNPEDSSGPFFEGTNYGVRFMIDQFPNYTLDPVSGSFDLAAFYAISISAALLFVTGLVRRDAPAATAPTGEGSGTGAPSPLPSRSIVFRYRIAGLAALLLVLYFLVPWRLSRPFEWWFVSGRFAPWVCFFAFLIPAGLLRGYRSALLFPGILAAFLFPIHVSDKYAGFNARAKPFVRMVEHARPGTHILFLSMRPRTDPAVVVAAYDQFAAWMQILRGDYSAAGWFAKDYLFKVKKHLPSPVYYNHEAFDPIEHAGPYTYVIVRNEPWPIFETVPDEWRVIDEEGPWKMYERIGPPSSPDP